MKKTLIALAAVAATSAAFAQSTVTLSGTVDVGLQDVGGTNSPLSMVSSRHGTSNWTVSGAEDLGGGLKAIFKISTSFNADDGTTAGNVLGNNDMFVGLQGGFGSLKLGRSFNPAFFYALTANSTKGVTGYSTRAGTVETDGVYISNQVLYTTPNFGGFTGQISYAPSEVAGASAHRGVGIGYAAGPLAVNFAHSKLAAAAAGATVNALNLIAASYDFSVAKLHFTYTDRNNVASDADNTWGLGVTAPVGPGLVYASYDRSEVGAGTTRVIHGGYKYFLSKRTTAYLNIGNKKNAQQAFNGSAVGKAVTGWGVGLAHNF
ncbi:porin [Hydrogenophaga sp.]|uniref:porin n=1 Tax=Hydrogenophaga sp. TaxID=1904254 RepID=UPI003D0AD584